VGLSFNSLSTSAPSLLTIFGASFGFSGSSGFTSFAPLGAACGSGGGGEFDGVWTGEELPPELPMGSMMSQGGGACWVTLTLAVSGGMKM
jgi:hypothetical protein